MPLETEAWETNVMEVWGTKVWDGWEVRVS